MKISRKKSIGACEKLVHVGCFLALFTMGCDGSIPEAPSGLGESENITRAEGDDLSVKTSASCKIEIEDKQDGFVDLMLTASNLPAGGKIFFGRKGKEEEVEVEDASSKVATTYRLKHPSTARKYVGKVVGADDEDLDVCEFVLGPDEGEDETPVFECTLSSSKTSVISTTDSFELTLEVTGDYDSVSFEGDDVTPTLVNGRLTISNNTISADKQFVATVFNGEETPYQCVVDVDYNANAPGCDIRYLDENSNVITSITAPGSFYVEVDVGAGGPVTTLLEVTDPANTSDLTSSINSGKVFLSAAVPAGHGASYSRIFRVTGDGGTVECDKSLTVVSSPTVPTCNVYVQQGGQNRSTIALSNPTTLTAVMQFGTSSGGSPSSGQYTYGGQTVGANNDATMTKQINFNVEGTRNLTSTFMFDGQRRNCSGSVSVTYTPVVSNPTCSVLGKDAESMSSTYSTNVTLPYEGLKIGRFKVSVSGATINNSSIQVRKVGTTDWGINDSTAHFTSNGQVEGRIYYNSNWIACTQNANVTIAGPLPAPASCTVSIVDQSLGEIPSQTSQNVEYFSLSKNQLFYFKLDVSPNDNTIYHKGFEPITSSVNADLPRNRDVSYGGTPNWIYAGPHIFYAAPYYFQIEARAYLVEDHNSQNPDHYVSCRMGFNVTQ